MKIDFLRLTAGYKESRWEPSEMLAASLLLWGKPTQGPSQHTVRTRARITRDKCLSSPDIVDPWVLANNQHSSLDLPDTPVSCDIIQACVTGILSLQHRHTNGHVIHWRNSSLLFKIVLLTQENQGSSVEVKRVWGIAEGSEQWESQSQD